MIRDYKLSKDYHLLKELLDKGYEVLATNQDKDATTIKKIEDDYRFRVRPFTYFVQDFMEFCVKENIEFIEPTEE